MVVEDVLLECEVAKALHPYGLGGAGMLGNPCQAFGPVVTMK